MKNLPLIVSLALIAFSTGCFCGALCIRESHTQHTPCVYYYNAVIELPEDINAAALGDTMIVASSIGTAENRIISIEYK